MKIIKGLEALVISLKADIEMIGKTLDILINIKSMVSPH
jgi:hypothetical protein